MVMKTATLKERLFAVLAASGFQRVDLERRFCVGIALIVQATSLYYGTKKSLILNMKGAA